MLRLRFVAPLLVVGMVGSSFLLGQDKKTDREIIIRARLPMYYSKLGLSQKQRNEIYKVHGKYQAEIQELYEKINDLRDQDREACAKLLTAEQKDRLRQILLGSNRKGNIDDEDAPAKEDKKKTAETKSKKKDTDGKDKKVPGEIGKPIEIKK
jgi:hypothetical protein